jgi:Spy/CpxP family protein refolding chaperone
MRTFSAMRQTLEWQEETIAWILTNIMIHIAIEKGRRWLMKSLFLMLAAVSFLAGSTMLVAAQNRTTSRNGAEEVQKSQDTARDYTALIREMFAPISDQLNLTKEQQFQMVAIVSGTEANSASLLHNLEVVDQRLAEAAIADVPDEDAINQLSSQEALILSEMIAMKARAKAAIYRVLMPDQRALVTQLVHTKSQVEGNLGAISVY